MQTMSVAQTFSVFGGGGGFETKSFKNAPVIFFMSVCPSVRIREHLNEFSSNMVQIGLQQ